MAYYDVTVHVAVEFDDEYTDSEEVAEDLFENCDYNLSMPSDSEVYDFEIVDTTLENCELTSED